MYFLEKLHENVHKKMPYSYERRALSVLMRDEWVQICVCKDKEKIEKFMANLQTQNPKGRYRITSNMADEVKDDTK